MGDYLRTRRSNGSRAGRRTGWCVLVLAPWVLLPALVVPVAALRAAEPPAPELTAEPPAAAQAAEPPAPEIPVESGEAPIFSLGPLTTARGAGCG